VRQLVRDHRAHLLAGEVVDQVVVEHHPLRRAEPAHVRVGRGGPPACVDPVDLAHVHVGALGKLEHLGPQRPVGQALEVVEHGIDDHGEEPDRDHADRHHPARRGRPPAARKAPHHGHRQRRATRREQSLDAGRLRGVAQPGAPVLGRKAHVDRALVRHRRQRQAHDDERQGYARAGGGRPPDRPAARRLQGTPHPGRGPQGEEGQHRAADHHPSQPEQALDGAEVLGPVELGGAEVGFDVDRGRVDEAAPGPENQRRRPGGDDRHNQGQRQPRAMTSHPGDTLDTDPARLPGRIALISDVHANLPAFEAVLGDISTEGVDATWNLGDLVGYGAQPNECVALAAESCDLCLVGNHDLVVLGDIDMGDFSHAAAAAAEWTREQIAKEALDFLGGLERTDEDHAVGLYHASPRDPVWEYVLSDWQAEACFEVMEPRVGAVGHSHVALFFTDGGGEVAGDQAPGGHEADIAEGRWMLNPGGVGQPRDGDARAAWLLLDTDSWTASWRRVDYPIDKAAAAIEEAGLPSMLAQRLYVGQ
jgi:diadenosine tetraphosphatase ApaH/serine/threonine PP2A family protein phosphatase